MFILLKLAWRNIFRNKRRTLLSGLAIGIGLACLILVDGLYKGMIDNMIRTGTDTFLGQGEIHRTGFRKTFEVEKTINDHRTVLRDLAREPIVKAFSRRTISFSMLTSAANVTSVLLIGIDPAREQDLSRIDEAIAQGRYLETDDRDHILLGSKLAETLEAGIGDRIVVTMAQAETGDLSQEMFRVGGIFRMNEREMDGGMAFIPLARSQELLGINDRIHEIVLQFTDLALAGDPALPFWTTYSQNGNTAEGWKEILPEMEAIIGMTDIGNAIVLAIVFGIVALITMNTLFMSLYERMFEFGLLRAFGTRPSRMALLIFFETASLAIVSIVIGDLLGVISSWYFAVYGIDYRGFEMGGVTLQEVLRTVPMLYQFILYPAFIMVFALIAAIYPAVYAARLVPAKAMKRSM